MSKAPDRSMAFMPAKIRLEQASQTIDGYLEKYFWRLASIFSIVLFIYLIWKDIHLKLWLDELNTVYITKQNGPVEIIKATAEGTDAAPPLYSIIVQSLRPLLTSDALALRFPSTVGFCAMVLGVLAFARPRIPAVYAFIAALLSCDMALYYGTEGRPYGLVLGIAAATLVCWRSAVESRKRGLPIALLAICSAAVVAVHYYTIFFLLCLTVAEITRWRERHSLDFSITLALLVPALFVIGLHIPLAIALKRYQVHYVGHADVLEIIHFYERFIKIPILLALVSMVASFVFCDNLYYNNSDRRHFPSYELAAILCISLAPAAVVILSMFTTHVFVYRYCIWAVIGLGLLAAIMLHEVGRAQAVIGVTALGVLISSIAVKEIASLGKIGQLREGESIQRALANLPDNGESIVVPDAHAFLELSYYGNPELKERLVYPASPELDARYLGYDTEPLVLEALAPRANLHVQKYDQFISEHKRFILAIDPKDYLEWVLLKSGYSVIPVDSDARLPVIFTVEAGKP